MTRKLPSSRMILLAFLVSTGTAAQAPEAAKDGIYQTPAGTEQTESDTYTRYELLEPGTGKFKIYYEVTATTAGAKYYYNPIRKGSVATDESVYDPATGKALHFEVVSGADAHKDPLIRSADADTDYIRVTLARPVPPNGHGRMVIIKTYEDAKSYYLDGKTLVFDRPLGIKRNVVVLPKGYELIGSASPAIVSTDPDGRVRLSFLNDRDDQLPVKITARRLP